MMLDYGGARAVALIVQTGSFDGAAQLLHVTPSAISQRVRSLEERLGTVLIRRGQPCTATEAGAWLCRHMEQVGMLEHALMAHLPGLADTSGPAPVTLDIATNADSLGTWLMPALAGFAAQTGYLFNLAIEDQDHTAEWLRRGQVLAAVTSLDQAVQGCMVRPLGRLRYHATASPAFMARHFAGGVTPATLALAPALMFNRKDRLQQDWVRQVLGQGQHQGQMPPLPCHMLPSTQGFVEACCAGLGWGLNPACLVQDHLSSGALVELLPGHSLDVALYWQVSRLAADRLQGLTQAVQAAARDVLV
jgi:LysR family transcriptional regulator, chromosome initiation inhibitor